MKKISLFILSLILITLLGCKQNPICNEPYILIGTDCCLDSDNNFICDNDEKSVVNDTFVAEDTNSESNRVKEPKKEEIRQIPKEQGLITKSVSQMALLSIDMESGYVLRREDSGMFALNEQELFKNLSLKSVVSSLKLRFDKESDKQSEERELTLYLFKFDNVEFAEIGYEELVQQTNLSKWYVEYPLINEKADDLKVYKKEIYIQSNYDFYQYIVYSINVRVRNVVARMYLGGNPTKISENEITLYLNKLLDRIKSSTKIDEEISLNQKAKTYSEDEKLEIEVREVKRNGHFSVSDEYRVKGIPSYTGNREKEYLYIQMYIRNLEVDDSFSDSSEKTMAGFYAKYSRFSVTDNEGNIFYPTSDNVYLEGYQTNRIIKKGNGAMQTIAIPIFKSSEDFVLNVYDSTGNEVAQVFIA